MERTFFTTAVALNVSGIAPAMIAWIGLKMLTNWNRQGATPDSSDLVKQTRWIRGAFTALLAGLPRNRTNQPGGGTRSAGSDNLFGYAFFLLVTLAEAAWLWWNLIAARTGSLWQVFALFGALLWLVAAWQVILLWYHRIRALPTLLRTTT